MDYVIIGAGPAGVVAAETLRGSATRRGRVTTRRRRAGAALFAHGDPLSPRR